MSRFALFLLLFAFAVSCGSSEGAQPQNGGGASGDGGAAADGGDDAPGLGVLAGPVGYVDDDRNPQVGALGNFGYDKAAALDFKYRSVGVDLGAVRSFDQVRLTTDKGPTRVRKMDLSLYASEDNQTFTRVADWDAVTVGTTTYLYNFSARARYVKVHCHFDDDAFDFTAANLQTMVKVVDETRGVFVASGGGVWTHRKPITVSHRDPSTIYDRAVFVSKASLEIDRLVADGKLKADLSDVRFSDPELRELHFHREAGGFWVRIPELAAGRPSTVLFHYGNPAATFRGEGETTFEVEHGNKTLHEYSTLFMNPMSVRMPNGSLFMISNGGDPAGAVQRRISTDEGHTWSEPKDLVNTNTAGRDEGGNFVIDTASGTAFYYFYTYSFYKPGAGLDPAQTRSDLSIMRSNDSGATWSAPQRIDTGKNYNVSYSAGIKLAQADGPGPHVDYLFPLSYVLRADGSFATSAVYSADGGATWVKSASDIAIPSTGFEGGITEGSAIELADGTLKMFLRRQVSDGYNLCESESTDGGVTWTSPPRISQVYSSNTMNVTHRFDAPSSTHDGDILMAWGSNNAMGATSYFRTPFSLAVSSDETVTWRRHLDLLGRTRLSVPHLDGPDWVVVQPGFTRAGADSYYFTWHKFNRSYGLLVEDFERFLYRTHGAYDSFERTSLANDYWWEVFPTVESSSAKGGTDGSRALRIHDDSTTTLTRASRYVPSFRKGQIRFKLNAASLASMLVIELKEAYSESGDAPGGLVELQVFADGSLRTKNAAGAVVELPVVTDLPLDRWTELALRFDASTDQLEVRVDGESKGVVPAKAAGRFVNFLQFSSGSTADVGTDVYLDELTVVDEDVGLPVVDFVGPER
jgi:hypothetical protein